MEDLSDEALLSFLEGLAGRKTRGSLDVEASLALAARRIVGTKSATSATARGKKRKVRKSSFI